MATTQSTANFLIDQMALAGNVRSRKMFGEYAVYCEDKVVALVCDERLFVKQTNAGRAFIGEIELAPPYPGAKPHFLIEEDRWEDPEWLSTLIRKTADALPLRKRKR
jgi:TfoX/Sxy family transcriptional regulator of competence genes